MNTIYTGKAYEMLPLSNGILYSYNREELENGESVVAYKMVSFENGRVTDAGRNIYLITKYGNNYKEIIKHCENFVLAKAVILPEGRALIINEQNQAFIVENDGEVIWSGSFFYRSLAPSDMVYYNGALWASYKDCDALVKYNITNMREELRIGGNNSPFNKPCDLFIENDSIVVCNKGDNSVISVNLNNYCVTQIASFESELKQYISTKNYRFVLLQDGIYLL